MPTTKYIKQHEQKNLIQICEFSSSLPKKVKKWKNEKFYTKKSNSESGLLKKSYDITFETKKRKCEEKKLLPNNTKYVFVCHMPKQKHNTRHTKL